MSRALPTLLIAVALATAGCPAPSQPGATGGGSAKASTKAKPGTGATPIGGQAPAPDPPVVGSPGQPPIGATTVLPTAGGGVVANNGGTLVGRVTVPAQIVANHSAGLVSNNGGTLIANNGGSYRIMGVDQLPIQGVRVQVLDAAGLPLVIDGQEVATVTGPDGKYAFTQALPARNLIVRVELPGTAGELRAIAPPDAAARQDRNVDLVSTLTTAYILEKYVRSQADQQATLDKLPATVEAETRAAAALAVATAAAPADLKPATAVAAVDALRQADPSLDAQLEKVRALLIAAGVADLGAGRPALSVALAPVEQIAGLADGRLYMSCPRDRRIWTLDGQGKLQVALGKDLGAVDPAPAGKPGAEVAIAAPVAIAADGTGLLVLEATRLLRLGADGKVEVRATGFARAKALFRLADGRQLIVTQATTKQVKGADKKYTTQIALPAQVLEVPAAGGAASVVKTLADPDSLRLRNLVASAPGEAGALWLGVRGSRLRDATIPDAAAAGGTAVLALDPTSYALTEVARLDNARPMLAFDQGGRLLTRAGEQLTAVRGGGAAIPLGPDVYTRDFLPIAPLPGGAFAWAEGGLVYRAAAGQPRAAIAGLINPPREGVATDLSFGELAALGVGKDGGLAFVDPQAARLWRVDASGYARTLLDLPDGWPTEEDNGLSPTQLGLAADGTIWIRDEGDWEPRLLRVSAAGSLSRADVLAEGESFDDLAVLPDGGAAMLVSMVGEDMDTVIRLVKPDGTRGAQVTIPEDEQGLDLAAGPDGAIWLVSDDSLRRWKPGGSWETVVDADTWLETGPYWGGTLAIGADNKPYGADYDGVGRYDPVAKTYTVVLPAEGGALMDAAPSFDGAGNLFVLDPVYRQVKRVAAGGY